MIMVHLLKLQHSPASDLRIGWRETIRTQRTRLLNDLTPSLRDRGEHAAADGLPETCPYSIDQIEGDWLP